MSHPQDNKSTHLPEVSGNIAAVTGSLVVDTGLTQIQTLVAALAEDSSATEAIVTIEAGERPAGGTIPATIKVWAVDGVTPGAAAVNVGWLALGK